MVSRTVDLSALVALFYDAAVEPAQWAPAWGLLATHLDAESGILFLDDPASAARTLLAAFGCSSNAFAGFRAGLNLPEAELHQHYEHFAHERYAAQHVLMICLPIRPLRKLGIAFHRPRGAAPFNDANRRLLTDAARYLIGALRQKETLDLERADAQIPKKILDHAQCGNIVLAADGTVVYVNRTGRFLCTPEGLLIGARGIEARTPTENTRLQRLLQSVRAGDEGGAQRVTRAPPHVPLAVLVSRLPGDEARHRVMLTLRELAGRLPARGPQARELFALTTAESEVLDELLDGLTARAIAAKRNVSLYTVQAQVRHILSKTGAEKMRDLIKIMSALSG